MNTPTTKQAGLSGTPVDRIDPSDPMLFHNNQQDAVFKRLRREDPVHFCAQSRYGPYWSITRYKDIAEVDGNHKVFSSAAGITLDERQRMMAENATETGGFIRMDPPKHDTQRKIITPTLAPDNLLKLEASVRERTRAVLEGLPVGEEFDWVERVSINLTLRMIAILLGVDSNDLARLKHWSDVITYPAEDAASAEAREQELREMAHAFFELREMRRREEPTADLISMLAHSPFAQGMTDAEYISNIGLLVVGGNDTTRNTMSGSIVAFDKHPDQWSKLISNPRLLESAIPEMIRWQTPVLHQTRLATEDYQLGNKTIREGDRVALWYISGNRDETVIRDPDAFIIDRERPRQHIAFGVGIHHCLGSRLAEMQLRILWEEIIRQEWRRIEVTGAPVYAMSNTLRGIDLLPVRIHG